MTNKIAVIGAGISGTSIARMLSNHHKVTIFEKSTVPGGLIKCTNEGGLLYHRIGGHVFNSKNPEVLHWFWQFFDKEKEFIQTHRNAKILLENQLINYPIENFIYQFPQQIGAQIIKELLQLNKQEWKQPFEYPNFEKFLLNNFGQTLYEIYFKPYNEKIWKQKLSNLPMDWLEGKLPMPNLEKIIYTNIFKKEEKEMVHSTFYYPQKGGSQFIIDRIAKGLDLEKQKEVTTLAKNGRKWILNGKHKFDQVVYTGDIRNLPKILKEEHELKTRLGIQEQDFKSNGTTNILCQTDPTQLSWMYLPSNQIKAHRIIYTGNFSQSNNNENQRKSCVVEFSGKYTEQEIIQDLSNLPGNLRPIQMNYEKNTYVIQDQKTREKIRNAKSILEPLGIHLVGRFAEWEYYNMDKCIESAMGTVKTINNLLRT